MAQLELLKGYSGWSWRMDGVGPGELQEAQGRGCQQSGREMWESMDWGTGSRDGEKETGQEVEQLNQRDSVIGQMGEIREREESSQGYDKYWGACGPLPSDKR